MARPLSSRELKARVAELEEENQTLTDENQSLTDKLDSIQDIVAEEEEGDNRNDR